MGRMFMKARMMERKAVIFQKRYQSHTGGKSEPMAPKPPNDLAPSAVKTYFMSSTYEASTCHPYLMPAGKLSKNPYWRVTGL